MVKLITLGAVAGCMLLIGGCSQEDGDAQSAERSTTNNAAADETAAAEDFKTYDARAFYETTSYSMASGAGYAFSPDNAHLLIAADDTGIFNAQALSTQNGDATALTQSVSDSTFALSWFANDRRILFYRDNGGDELDHVFVREEDGAVQDLTPGENVKASFAGWSNDGSAFYLITNERDARSFDLYRYQTDGYARELIYENKDSYQLGDVTADGRYVALSKPRTSADSDVYIVDLTEDDPVPVHVTPHEGNVSHSVYGFKPDGSALIYSTNEFGEFNQAWSYELASGEKSELIAEDWDVMYVQYSPSGKYRVWAVNEDARTKLRIKDETSGGMLDTIEIPEGAISNVRFSRDESKIAFLLSSDTSPANVMIADLNTGAIKTLTDALNPAIDENHLVDAEVVRYESFDGLKIPSILYKPKGASADNPAPALVWVHGGPGGQSRAGYSATIQHLVNHGYAVLAANNRGSSGYGKTFFHMDDKKHGEVDLDDIVYAEKWLAAQDWVDPDRIGIIGGSYGGYMVGAALAFRPEVYKVGVNIFGVMNWVRTLESIPPWWESFRESLFDEMGDPATDAERHRQISPLFHAENIKVPLLVVQGANDPRVLKVESDEIVDAVRANGVPVEYVVFDDEGHGFTKRENRITASEAYVNFLDTYLKGDGGAQE